MAKAYQLDDLLVNVSELETFLHTFLGKLDPKKLKANEDLTPFREVKIFEQRKENWMQIGD